MSPTTRAVVAAVLYSFPIQLICRWNTVPHVCMIGFAFQILTESFSLHRSKKNAWKGLFSLILMSHFCVSVAVFPHGSP